MSEPKFTPGDWRAVETSADGQHRVVAGDQVVCYVNFINGHPMSQYGYDTEGANARLLAAAPALYAACKTMKEQLDLDEPSDWAGARAKMNAALALADGETA